MTQDEIIHMAREAGLPADDEAWVSLHQEAMERFAARVAANENAAYEAICEENETKNGRWCAAAIRARGEK